MKAYAVLGANFGDEGKGLTTDYLASQQTNNSIVVRFNGGAQAAHTVQTPLNQRHVFKHIGSGSFCNSATFLSEFFICNPLLFRNEYEQLLNYNLTPQIYVHPQAIITTPYDMMINQIAEEHRGNNRHGSCGVGINETVERSVHPEFTLRVQDLYNREQLIQVLDIVN